MPLSEVASFFDNQLKIFLDISGTSILAAESSNPNGLNCAITITSTITGQTNTFPVPKGNFRRNFQSGRFKQAVVVGEGEDAAAIRYLFHLEASITK